MSTVTTSITLPKGIQITPRTATVYPNEFEICEDFPAGFKPEGLRLYARIVAYTATERMVTTVLRVSPKVTKLLIDREITVRSAPVFGTNTEPGSILRKLFTSCKVSFFSPDVKFRVELCTDSHPFIGKPQSQPARH